MNARALTLSEQQALPYAEKLELAKRVASRLWLTRFDLTEDERIDYLDAECTKLERGDAAAGKKLAMEVWP